MDGGDALTLAFRTFLGFSFLLAGLPKLFDRDRFQRAIEGYRLVPSAWSGVLAVWVPRVEVAAGAGLLLGVGERFFSVVLLVLLISFTGAVVLNLARGREIDCGCFGAGAMRPITWLTVARNLLLIGLAGAVYVSSSDWSALPIAREITEFGGVAAVIGGLAAVPGFVLLSEVVHLRSVIRSLDDSTQLMPS